MQRIAVIGNAGGGKTTLSQLPAHHVDSFQYQSGWERTPAAECDRKLDDLATSASWIICPEFSLSYSWKLARVMWEVNRDYRPWFGRLIEDLPDAVSVVHIRSPKEWRASACALCTETTRG